MSHLDSNALAAYNSLVDPNLKCYFSNERIRSHLKHAGLISRRGEIISQTEYRARLARREHKKHVRQMLAENIVHRAIDMERARQAELRRQFDLVAKVSLVNNMKESRRPRGHSSTGHSHPPDTGFFSMNSSWSQKPAVDRLPPIDDDDDDRQGPRISRVHSAVKSRRRLPVSRPKSSTNPKELRSSPTLKSSENDVCRLTMIYYGSHGKVDSADPSLFDPSEEILVMQQHCGGENLVVFKQNLRAGEQFTFQSRRHADYPLGLAFYIKGLIDSRISTCCEYKHRNAVRLGGERGHFGILAVQGSKPCLKCRFERQVRMKDTPDEDETVKPITISIPASDQPRLKETPVKIPVRHDEGDYSEDFSGGEEKKEKSSPAFSTRSSTTTIKDEESFSPTKTWQIIFHTTNMPMGSLNSSGEGYLRFSFLSAEETDSFPIDLTDFPQCFKSGRHDSFAAKLKNLGQPEHIRLMLDVPPESSKEIKWHLDHIELIDPESQSHWKYPCQQWIRPGEEHLISREGLTKFNAYRLEIVSSMDDDGEFNALTDSRMFLRVNDDEKEVLVKHPCPSFQPGQSQTFNIHLPDRQQQPVTKITLGYQNSDITAGKWQIEKMLLTENSTGKELLFRCAARPLLRDEMSSRAEQTFAVELGSQRPKTRRGREEKPNEFHDWYPKRIDDDD